VIICYHKARRKYYVIKDKTKDGRKFLFYSSSLKECQDFAGPTYTVSRSAREAMDPTRPTPSSDAETGRELVHDPIIGLAHPTRIRQREENK
jgi:hypothetical protein